MHDLKEWQGQLYFTMEYIEGRSLRQLINGRRDKKPAFTLPEAVAVINPLLDALYYAHKFTIHRDVKPENIIIVGEFPDVSIKVLDLGIAKTLSPSRFSMTSQMLGTPYYVAPEQRRGGKVDNRADLYAVGQILYELFTGEIADVLPEMPSQLYPELPAEVDLIIARLLKKEPSQRYSSAGEVKAGLEKA